jgi:hypothetical protein
MAETIAVTIEDYSEAKREAIEKKSGCAAVDEVDLNLDEIFEAFVIGNRGQKVNSVRKKLSNGTDTRL